ncbi:MAG: sce7725 family protein [Dyadobacter fermentans]
MYLPFLRGKQFELLALRELTTLPLMATKITPIIEPVKKDLKSVETAIRTLSTYGINVLLIVNPEQGDLKKDYVLIEQSIDRLRKSGLDNIVPTYIIGNERDFTFFSADAKSRDYLRTGYALVHLNQISKAAELKAITASSNLTYNIIHVNHLIALRRGFPTSSLAILSDPFVKQKRNVDYEESEDEIFSSDYFYYKSEGFSAFADYLTIGTEYIEGGMLPYAVVIHLTYKDKESENVRIRHFLSDNNLDTSDTAGKFGEALAKLVEFIDKEDIHTLASEQFRDYYNRGAYPGLGVIKKLSLMHHIELIQSLI